MIPEMLQQRVTSLIGRIIVEKYLPMQVALSLARAYNVAHPHVLSLGDVAKHNCWQPPLFSEQMLVPTIRNKEMKRIKSIRQLPNTWCPFIYLYSHWEFRLFIDFVVKLIFMSLNTRKETRQVYNNTMSKLDLKS